MVGRKRIERKKFEIHGILQNLLYQCFYHFDFKPWTLCKKSTKNTSDTANYTALNTGRQNMTFTANVVAKFVFLPVIARYQHTYYWLDSCFLEELLYCLMLWTILFYSFLFSWEFLSGLWLANLSVTSSIQNTYMQVILNVYLRNDDFLLKVTELSSYVL